MRMVDVRPYRSQSMSTLPQQPESPLKEVDDPDGSLPLYVMYSKINQEKDNKEAEHGQQFMDGLLVFVSPHVTSQLSLCLNGMHRLVYSPPLSLHCLPSQSQT